MKSFVNEGFYEEGCKPPKQKRTCCKLCGLQNMNGITHECDLEGIKKREVYNNCDGCQRGLPLKDGIHKGKGYDMIGCTKDRYQCKWCQKRMPFEKGEHVYTHKSGAKLYMVCINADEYKQDKLCTCGKDKKKGFCHHDDGMDCHEDSAFNLPVSKMNKCCLSCWNGDNCTKTMCDCHMISPTWEDKERKAWMKLCNSKELSTAGIEIADYWISRLREAREEGRIAERREYGDAKAKGRSAALEEVKEKYEQMDLTLKNKENWDSELSKFTIWLSALTKK